MSDEEIDRAGLRAFYREMIFLILGLVIGACLFALFAASSSGTGMGRLFNLLKDRHEQSHHHTNQPACGAL